MQVQLLGCGTSTGVPLVGCRCPVCTSSNPKNKRSRTSALLRLGSGRNVLIDASTDLRSQCLTHDVRAVDAVIFTHAHADHILGIEDLRAFNFLYHKPIPCYGTAFTLGEIKRFYGYIFTPDPTYEGGALVQLTLHEIQQYSEFEVCGTAIKSFLLPHGKMDVTGFRIGKFGYATDCNGIPEESLNILRGVDILILDALREEPHRTHFTIAQALEAAARIGAKKTYLTHMTHSVDYDAVMAKLPPSVELAYDGLTFEVDEAS